MAGPDDHRRALELGFADEDAQVWIPSAREIGRRAVDDVRCRTFIRRELQDSAANVHRYRHACCAAAAYLSESRADASVFEDWVTGAVREPFERLALRSLTESGGKIRDLHRIPGAEARLEQWQTDERARLEARTSRLQGEDGSPEAIAALAARLRALNALEPDSPIPEGLLPKTRRLSDSAVWTLASYLAGVSGLPALLGLPFELVADGLARTAAARRTAGLGLVLNVPGVVARLGPALDAPTRKAVIAALERSSTAAWSADRLHYNDYARALQALVGSGFIDVWSRGVPLPASLTELLQVVVDAPQHASARVTARALRTLSEGYFSDDWRWSELTLGERFSLNVFALLVTSGPESLTGSSRSAAPSIEHRIAILLDAIERSIGAPEHILPTLVRCLKLVLHEELRAIAAPRDLVATCRRHIAIIRPLVAEWRLPGTLRKDLATIASRALVAAFRADRGAFAELFYAVLFALPDRMFFKEMRGYCAEPGLAGLLAKTARLLECGEDQPPNEAHDAYRAYHQTLVALVADAPSAGWVRALDDLVVVLSRTPASPVPARDLDPDLDPDLDLDPNGLTSSRSAPVSGVTGRAAFSHAPRGLAADVQETLGVLMCVRESRLASWRDLIRRRSADRRGLALEEQERDREMRRRARTERDRFVRLVDEIRILESECLPEMGRPRPADDLVRDWRRLIGVLDAATALALEALPVLERDVTGRLLAARIRALENRLGRLVEVFEKEDEPVARAMLTGSAVGGAADVPLVQAWMLSRYMVRELAETLHFRALRLLTDPRFVAAWLLMPFLVCMGLHAEGHYRWRGVPFAVITVLNLFLVVVYFVEARGSERLASGAGRYLLPQITAALFLGIMEVLSADEAWSLAVLEYRWVRLFTIVAFLATGFVFIREVLLSDQLPGRADRAKRTRRAASVMALVLWQSFALVVLFGVLGGRVMGGRAELEPQKMFQLLEPEQFGLPAEVHLGFWFVQPASGSGPLPADPAYRIFPWAILTWTVQVFFFSAVFERIMGARRR